MAQSLGINYSEVGIATGQVFGRDLVGRGIFDAGRFNEIHDLDNESLTPADFQMSSSQALGPSGKDEMEISLEETTQEIRPFVHLEADNVLVLPYEFLRDSGGTLPDGRSRRSDVPFQRASLWPELGDPRRHDRPC